MSAKPFAVLKNVYSNSKIPLSDSSIISVLHVLNLVWLESYLCDVELNHEDSFCVLSYRIVVTPC